MNQKERMVNVTRAVMCAPDEERPVGFRRGAFGREFPKMLNRSNTDVSLVSTDRMARILPLTAQGASEKFGAEDNN